MRGHYGDYKQAQCPVCTETFTKKQPKQIYCEYPCYLRRFSTRPKGPRTSVSGRTLAAVRRSA